MDFTKPAGLNEFAICEDPSSGMMDMSACVSAAIEVRGALGRS
ncbi:hypothetical protein [Rubritalea tangerina]